VRTKTGYRDGDLGASPRMTNLLANMTHEYNGERIHQRDVIKNEHLQMAFIEAQHLRKESV
jgi:hypothetical protein